MIALCNDSEAELIMSIKQNSGIDSRKVGLDLLAPIRVDLGRAVVEPQEEHEEGTFRRLHHSDPFLETFINY